SSFADDGVLSDMIARRSALLSIANRRIVGAIALLAVSISHHPSAAARKGSWSKAATSERVPNYGVIWQGKLTRSGQPRDEGWTSLREQGVRSLVNFRPEEDVDYHGVSFQHILWLPFTKETPPTDGQAEQFLAFVRNWRHWPIHIHCKHGKDRTGLMAALV